MKPEELQAIKERHPAIPPDRCPGCGNARDYCKGFPECFDWQTNDDIQLLLKSFEEEGREER